MTAELEEVVGHTDRANIQLLFPEANQCRLEVGASFHHPPGLIDLYCRKATAIDFPAQRQRRVGELLEESGNHVVRETVAQKPPKVPSLDLTCGYDVRNEQSFPASGRLRRYDGVSHRWMPG